MKEISYRGGLLFVALIIQTSLFPRVCHAYVCPDLILILICIFGLLRGSKKGAGWGLVAGFFQDLMGLNTNIIIKPLLGFLAGSIEGKIYKSNIWLPPVIMFLLSCSAGIINYVVRYELLFNLPWPQSFFNIILPGAFLDSLVCFVLYPILYRIEGRWYRLGLSY